MLDSYICALDIGNNKVSASVAEIKRKRIANIFFESLPSQGLSRGTLISSVDLVGAVSHVLKSLRNKSGIPFKYMYITMSGQDVLTKHSQAVIPLTERGNKVITPSDMQRVNEQALTLGSTLDEEIIHQLPFNYSIDAKSNINNPLGLYSHKLEVDMYLVCAKQSSLQSMVHVVNQAGFEVKAVFFSGLATSEAVCNKAQGNRIHVLCDIGSDITELLIFKDAKLVHIEILLAGGNDLTKKLQNTFKIPFDFAEDIKRSYGIIEDTQEIQEDKEILIKREGNYSPIKQKLVSGVITSEVKSLCNLIKENICRYVDLSEVSNVVVCGRTALQDGFIEMLETILGVKTQLGRPVNQYLSNIINKHEALSGQKYVSYLTCLGIICLALNEYQPPLLAVQQSSLNPILKAVNKIKDMYQEYF